MASRLDESIQAMAEVYPHLICQLQTLSTPKGTVGVWRGLVQPIKHTADFLDLLDDLCHDREVYVIGDEVLHWSSCKSLHCRHEWMEKIENPNTVFEIEIRFDGGPAPPKCWLTNPKVPNGKWKHVWSDGSICAFLASERVWRWQSDTVATFLPHALIWLVKHMVYTQTGEWIGAQHQFSAQYHLEVVRPKDPCWCASGRSYRKCHRKHDLVAAGYCGPRR